MRPGCTLDVRFAGRAMELSKFRRTTTGMHFALLKLHLKEVNNLLL